MNGTETDYLTPDLPTPYVESGEPVEKYIDPVERLMLLEAEGLLSLEGEQFKLAKEHLLFLADVVASNAKQAAGEKAEVFK